MTLRDELLEAATICDTAGQPTNAAPFRRAAEAIPDWQPIETAPKDGTRVLVYYDHDADPYQDPDQPSRLTDYAAWAEGGDFMDGRGFCLAAWQPQFWESVDEYGAGYWLPAAWFALENSDYERVVNPTHWMPLPEPPNA